MKIGNLISAIENFEQHTLVYDKELLTTSLGIKIKSAANEYVPVNYVIKKLSTGVKLILENKTPLICADKHILYSSDNLPVYADSLLSGSYIRTRTGLVKILEIQQISEQPFYDVSIPAPHVYCDSSGVLHHNTIMTATMSALIEPFGRSVVIVPNKDLVKQTYDDYFNLGLDVGVYFGDKKELNKTHTICTWQSLNIIDKKFKAGESEMSLADFSQDMIAVIVDECHGTKAEVLQKLLNGPFANIPIRWGLTGTIPKEDYEKMGLLTSIGPVVGNIAASDLQAQGVLSNCNIKIVQLADNVEYSSYQEELSYLTTDQKRMNYFATMIESIAESGNTLVLVDRIKCGEMLKEAIAGSVFVSGSMKSKDRKDEYDEVALADNKIVIASYGVAAVGINIVRLHNIVLLEPGKSFVRVIQSIGRGLRKGFDKDSVEIWDITSNCKFSKRHLPVRKSYYTEAGYPFTVQKLKWK